MLRRGAITASAVIALALLVVATALAAAPPFEPPQAGQLLYDFADIFPAESRRATNEALGELETRSGARLIVYTHLKPSVVGDTAAADGDAATLLGEWGLDGSGLAGALVWAFDRERQTATIGVAVSDDLGSRQLDATELRRIVDAASIDDLEAGRWLAALTRSTVAVSVALPFGSPLPGSPTPSGPPGSPPPGSPDGGIAPPAGPPYPDPVDGQVVYDFASVFDGATETGATDTIKGIEQRTGAEVVVYTQVKATADSFEEAERDAVALVDQWGVGRQGFDDGLVILFDMDGSAGCHGQVQLYAGPGYRASFLTNEERQRIYETEMLPLLRACDMPGALNVALAGVDANATPAHAASLQTARQVDAVLGLAVAPLVFILLVGWAGSSWWRYGKDPVYLDDASILMPAPPPEVTAASGALLRDGRSSRHTLTTAMIDLASRGEIAFVAHEGLLRDKVGVQVMDHADADARTERNRRRPLGSAETYALERLKSIGRDENGLIEPDELLRFGSSVGTFDDHLEAHVARRGWFREPPSKATERWNLRAGVEWWWGSPSHSGASSCRAPASCWSASPSSPQAS